jgi:adenylate cyclase
MRRPASLGGEEREVTVLFTDIRGFTSLSESSTPTAILEFLNSYFAEVTHVIEAHSGIVDKYIGDAVMAVFGAPVASARHAAQAVECAFALRRALAVFNEKLVESGRKPVGTGMGIATGLVVAGVMGSESRHNYTFLGDTVNLAARLQDETKKFGVDAVVAGSTVEASGLGDFFEPLGSLTVRGKTAAVDVFSLRRA